MRAPTRCSETLADLERLLEPLVWITNLGWRSGFPDVAKVEGYAKMLGWPIDPLRGTPVGEHEPAEIRAAMFASAQEAIRVAEEAGYVHEEHPVFEIGGTAQHAGGLVLYARGTLRLALRPPKRTSERPPGSSPAGAD